ncbi:MAG: alpha-aminoadipate/glutamate carrier protein LysW [Planctomycetota bacterium]
MQTTQTTPTAAPTTTPCPECGAPVPIPHDAIEGEILPCPECSAELELRSLAPLQVELAPEVEEDWGE